MEHGSRGPRSPKSLHRLSLLSRPQNGALFPSTPGVRATPKPSGSARGVSSRPCTGKTSCTRGCSLAFSVCYLSAQGWCQELINILNRSGDACPLEVNREGKRDSGENRFQRTQRIESKERGAVQNQASPNAGWHLSPETPADTSVPLFGGSPIAALTIIRYTVFL